MECCIILDNIIDQLPLIIGWNMATYDGEFPGTSVWCTAVSDSAESSEESGALGV